MIFRAEGGSVFVRLHPGDELLAALCEVARSAGVAHLGIASGLGMLRDVDLAYFIGSGQYQTTHFDDPMELVSLAGNVVTQDGDVLPHVHAALAGRDKALVGGHVLRGTVWVTNEILLLKIPIAVRKSLEPESGLLGISFP
jgi:predicted DNA-binding protein with PD1-like motif